MEVWAFGWGGISEPKLPEQEHWRPRKVNHADRIVNTNINTNIESDQTALKASTHLHITLSQFTQTSLSHYLLSKTYKLEHFHVRQKT